MTESIEKQIKAQVDKLFPRPWRLEWVDTNPPCIVAANGRHIAKITTGTIDGAYSTEVVLQLSTELSVPALSEETYAAFKRWMQTEHGVKEDIALDEFVELMEAHAPPTT